MNANDLSVYTTKETGFSNKKGRQAFIWIQDIKFSPDSSKVAFGAHSGSSHIEIFDVTDDGRPDLKGQKIIIIGLQSALVTLDWSVDSTHLAVNSSAFELKFINVAKLKDVAPT